MWMFPQPALAYVPIQTFPQLVETEPPANDGRGVLQPEQNLPPKIDESIPISQGSPAKPRTNKTNSNSIKSRPANIVQKNDVSDTSRTPNRRNYSKEEVKALIVLYSEQYGISPQTPLCIAEKKAASTKYSKNSRSSASGVFQYLSRTFNATDEGKAGESVFDADANIKAAVNTWLFTNQQNLGR